MKKYIVTTTSNAGFALTEPDLDMCGTLGEAEETARRFTENMGVSYFVFEVDLKLITSTRAVTTVEMKRHASAES